MARLVPVKCPNCGANVRVDPERELVTCDYCHTSSFVQTPERHVTEAMRQQHPVIDLTAVSNQALRMLFVSGGVMTALSVIGSAIFFFVHTPSGGSPAVPDKAPVMAELDRAKRYGFIQSPVAAATEVPLASPTAETRAPTNPGSSRPSDASPSKSSTRGEASKVTTGALTVSGRLDSKLIGDTVRKNSGRFRLCHEQALGRTPGLSGTVKARFVIGRDGSVSNVSNGGSDVADSALTSCILSSFYGLSFPPPEAGIVTVVYPVILRAEPKSR